MSFGKTNITKAPKQFPQAEDQKTDIEPKGAEVFPFRKFLGER